MPRKPFIPFWLMPGSWGLKGKTREIAQAEYELEQGDLEEKLLEINHRDDPELLAQKKLDLQLSFGEINQYEYDRRVVTLTVKDPNACAIAMMDVNLKYEKISQLEYDRKKADLLKEPWVSMPIINWDPAVSTRTYFQLDYNDYFYKHLLANGYEGEEEEVVNKWLNDVCISITEEINGMDGDLITPTRRADTPRTNDNE